jgi:hypothetical protein
MTIPERHKASPWPFLAMIGMAGCFFLTGASGLVAPWWGVTLLFFVWLLLFVRACRWWTPHPGRTLLLPVIDVVIWFGVLSAGGAWFGWSA